MAVAERILRKEGIAAVTTRRVAGELGLTPMALYRHFRGKDALVQALVEIGFAHWERRLARAVKARSPRRRLDNALAAYRDFALAEPRLFELMFLTPRPAVPSAPTSLAVELAADRGLTLAGFARKGYTNVYTNPERVT